MLKLAAGSIVDRFPRGNGRRPPRVEQEQTEWCWAACLQLLSQLIRGQHLEQCQVAELVLGLAPGQCCSGAVPCNFFLPPDDVVAALADVGLTANFVAGPLSANNLGQAVGTGPIAVGLSGTASGHMLLAVRMSGLEIVDILDPWLRVGSVEYQYLLNRHPLGDWSRTWLNIRR